MPVRGEKVESYFRIMKKEPYSPPTLIKLAPEQAKKLVADRKKWSEEEAAEFLESLRPQQQQKEEKRKRSA
jgi:hypothetical protein